MVNQDPGLLEELRHDTWDEWNKFLEFEPTAYGQAYGHVHILHEGMTVKAKELNGVSGRLMAFFVGRQVINVRPGKAPSSATQRYAAVATRTSSAPLQLNLVRLLQLSAGIKKP